jgi:hypothetical protein
LGTLCGFASRATQYVEVRKQRRDFINGLLPYVTLPVKTPADIEKAHQIARQITDALAKAGGLK